MNVFQLNLVYKTRWLTQVLKSCFDYCVKLQGQEDRNEETVREVAVVILVKDNGRIALWWDEMGWGEDRFRMYFGRGSGCKRGDPG